MNLKKDFSETEFEKNPFTQFGNWYREHLLCGILIPDTVSLGTSSSAGKVSVRTVLLKEFTENGFVFFTNYNSRKGKDLSQNNSAALLFYWPESGRQVRIEGTVIKISEDESESYFKSRPRESQLSAWASEQSSVIPDRQYLEKRYELFKNKFDNNPVKKPSHWGGYRLVAEWFEFWQEGEFRLHDRITYSKRNDIWIIARLAP